MIYILPFNGPVEKAAITGKTIPLNLVLIRVGAVADKFSLLINTGVRHTLLNNGYGAMFLLDRIYSRPAEEIVQVVRC